MGNRQFYNQMIIDACQQHQDKITNELDINTMKDVMQVNNIIIIMLFLSQ